ncbi:MAG: M48 family metalloprotease [Candidatus Eremiobacterota bacterium]
MKTLFLFLSIFFMFFMSGCDYLTLNTDEEILMGEQVALQVESYYDIYRDPATNARIQKIGRDLSRFTTRPYPFKFTVLDSDEVNAFALPGGHIYIFRGLLDMVLNDDQIAAIIAHEITHIEAQHFAQVYERVKRKEIFYNVAILATGGVAYRPIQVLSYLDAYVFEPKFSRENETECDMSSVQMLINSGRNPHEFAELFKIWEKEKMDTNWLPGWMNSHPDFITRIRNIEEEISLQTGRLNHSNIHSGTVTKGSVSEREEEKSNEPEEELSDYLCIEHNHDSIKIKWTGKEGKICKIECYGLNKKQRIIADGRTVFAPFTIELKNGNSVKYVIASVKYTDGEFLWDIIKI